MTQHEQDASIGRLTRELVDAKREREALSAELLRHGEFLRTLGQALIESPEKVGFPLLPGDNAAPHNFVFFITQQLPTVLQLQMLVDDLRAANNRVARLSESARQAGIA